MYLKRNILFLNCSFRCLIKSIYLQDNFFLIQGNTFGFAKRVLVKYKLENYISTVDCNISGTLNFSEHRNKSALRNNTA